MAALSGAFDVCDYMERERVMKAPEWADVFGTRERLLGSRDDLYAMVKTRLSEGIDLPKLFLTCGKADKLLPDTQRLHELFAAHGVPHAYRETEGGHSWDLWDEEIQHVLSYFFG